MRLVVVTEQRIVRAPDGSYWAEQGMGYDFWSRYQAAFDHVRLVARVRACDSMPNRALRVDGQGVSLWELPYYVGVRGYLRHAGELKRRVCTSAGPHDGVLLRVPSQLGSILARHRRDSGLPFALEMVGDPQDVFSKGSMSTPLRPWLRRRFTASQRSQARQAVGVAYVTERALQSRYPTGAKAVSSHYSSIELTADAFARESRAPDTFSGSRKLVSVGSLEQLYKGIDVLLRSIARLNASNFRVTLTHVGDGKYRSYLEKLAAELGVSDGVSFAGKVSSGAQVRNYLTEADLFVLPSRTEGLPRALIEAMAAGLPAIASTAGGSPELLRAPYLVEPGDEVGLAKLIRAMLSNVERLSLASQENLVRARDFRDSVLNPRRIEFYKAISDEFEAVL